MQKFLCVGAGQNSHKISKLFAKHFEKIAPKCVKVKVTAHHAESLLWFLPTSNAYQSGGKCHGRELRQKTDPTRGGGSIPMLALFKKELGLDSILSDSDWTATRFTHLTSTTGF